MVHCDKFSSCLVLNKGSTRRSFMQASLREICFLAAVGEFEVKATHIEGLLSRWELDAKYSREYLEISVGNEISVSQDVFRI